VLSSTVPSALSGDQSISSSPEETTAPQDASRLEVEDNHQVRELCGEDRRNLKAIERALGVRVALRGNLLTITGPPPARELAESLIRQLVDLMTRGVHLSRADVSHIANLMGQGATTDVREFLLDTIVMSSRKRPITPRSPNQKRYIDAIRRHDIVFGVGPAGTGKTYLAVAAAVAALQKGEVRRIVLTRPAVEAGEKLGFLPGDLAQKVNPYLRPLYDALHDMMEPGKCARLMEQGTIEVAPLAFMRGRTLGRSFVILDEAQNTTREQMKMFLTRIGVDSKAVVTGDITQIDLPDGRPSGLMDAREVLGKMRDIPFVHFSPVDVVRHHLVQRIVEAYGRVSAERARRSAEARESHEAEGE
jgi:phosphate starvation-inducible protein PhoH and related proteins